MPCIGIGDPIKIRLQNSIRNLILLQSVATTQVNHARP